jgi:uncharacterized SAM-binding protein YcdF (DUF218 family)
MMHAVKQLVGALATPLGLALAVALLGWLARMLGRRRLSVALLVSAAVWIYLAATMPVANALLAPLEMRYPPLRTDRSLHVAYIVVLGSHYAPRDGLPVTATLGPDGLARIVEGVRLARVFPEARLVVSGGAAAGHMPSARGYSMLAGELGIAPVKLVLVEAPRDTGEEAAAIVKLLGSSPFLLVTSASHMPRAMKLMTMAGARPVAAPTAHRADPSLAWSWRSLLPLASALRGTEIALHEYLGLLALTIGLQ